MCVFVWNSIIILVGGGAEIAQNILPYVYICKTDIPSPQITAAFPDVNSSTKNVKDSTGSNLLLVVKWEFKGEATTTLIGICRLVVRT